MMDTLFTARCVLRSPAEGDEDGLIALATDPAVRQFLGGPRDAIVAKASADALILEQTPIPAWAVRLRKREEAGCIGLITLAPRHDEATRELSYQFIPEYWGMGLAYECTQAVLRHAFEILNLPRLVSETQAANQASRRLLERVGMHEFRSIERFGATQVIYGIVNPQVAITPESFPSG